MKPLIRLIALSLILLSPGIKAFELVGFDDTQTTLDDLTGQGNWTLVMFWAHECGICRAEFPTISQFHTARPDVDVVGISIDGDANKTRAEDYLSATKPAFSNYYTSLLMAATNYELLTQEGFRGTPTFLLFTPEGELIGNNPGKVSVRALEAFIDKNSG